MGKLVVFVRSGGSPDQKVTVPAGWLVGPLARLLAFVLAAHNKKRAAAPLAAAHFEIEGAALGSDEAITAVLPASRETVDLVAGASPAVLPSRGPRGRRTPRA